MRIVVATKNAGKLVELRQLLDVAGLDLVGIDQAGVELPDVEETGQTYRDNALLKARAVAAITGQLALADDSGLEVDALGGAPGVHSARYAGGAGARANTEKLLAAMEGVPAAERTARFRCVIAVVSADSSRPAVIVEGTCEGAITRAMRGAGGFGYDPVFDVAPDELAKLPGRSGASSTLTMAELSDGEKNRISHRGKAVSALRAAWSAVERLSDSP